MNPDIAHQLYCRAVLNSGSSPWVGGTDGRRSASGAELGSFAGDSSLVLLWSPGRSAITAFLQFPGVPDYITADPLLQDYPAGLPVGGSGGWFGIMGPLMPEGGDDDATPSNTTA